MNSSNLKFLAFLLELLGGVGRRSTGRNYPSVLASVPETSQGPSQSAFSCDCLLLAHLPAGHLCNTSSPGNWTSEDTQAQQLWSLWGLTGWGEKTGSGALAEFGSGEGNCLYLICLLCTLKNTDILGCCCNICILGHCGKDSEVPWEFWDF